MVSHQSGVALGEGCRDSFNASRLSIFCMKPRILFSLLCLFALSFPATPAKAESELDQLCASFPYNNQCNDHVPASSEVREPSQSESAYTVLNADDWRSSKKVPYSEPVLVRDPFDGDYLAVIDKNFLGNLRVSGRQEGIVTNWSENYIRVFAYSIQKPCSGIDLFCPPSTTVKETSGLEIKIGDEVFRLEGNDGNFPVSAELAEALRNAPPGPAITRVTFEDSGAQTMNEIGAGTTEAWHTVYQEKQAQP